MTPGEQIIAATRFALMQIGMPPTARLHVVIDAAHIGRDHASVGTIPADRLREIIDSSIAKHDAQAFEAVNVLSKFTLNGIPPQLQLKSNG